MVTHFAPIRFYKQTALRTEAFTQSSFYAQIFLHREVCAQKKSIQTPLQLCTQGGFYAKKEVFTHRCFVQRCFCAHKCRHIGVFTHRTFSTEKPLHRTIFTYVFVIHKKHLTQRTLYTQTAHRHFYRPTFLHLETLPRTIMNNFLHSRNLFAQMPSRTKKYAQQFLQTDGFYTESSPHRSLTHRRFYTQKVLRTTFFTYRCFYTQMSLHRHKLHTETCAHSTRLHTANFYTERLCFPFLITYLSCSPSQIIFYSNKSLKS